MKQPRHRLSWHLAGASAKRIPVAALAIVILAALAGLAAPTAAAAQAQTRSNEIGGAPGKDAELEVGRFVFAGIGIDEYGDPELWKNLDNAVNDVVAVREVLQKDFGFDSPEDLILTNAEATADAIEELVNRLQNELQPEDNLIFFYAGHGEERVDFVAGEEVGRRGYIVPVDVDAPIERAARQYLEIENLLEEIARIPARHVLVILDSCYSGMALGGELKTRGGGNRVARELMSRVSRRVLTSAQGDELAADGGENFPDNSLFTGWLVEGLRAAAGTGTIPLDTSPDTDGDELVTVTEIYNFVRTQVANDNRSQQTPDFGAFELDQRGELVLTLESDPYEAVYTEAMNAYELDDLDVFMEKVDAAVGLRPSSPRSLYLSYLAAELDGFDGDMLDALEELSEQYQAGAALPAELPSASLRARLRSVRRSCDKGSCERRVDQ